MPVSLPTRLLGWCYWLPTRFAPWHRLPEPFSGLALLALRYRLRHLNLYDTEDAGSANAPALAPPSQAARVRAADGSNTDRDVPGMGRTLARFGRNVPIHHTWPEESPAILEPNPRLVSERLLARQTFQPATSLNMLAACWIQFQVHGWFSHGDNEPDDPWMIELGDDDVWPADERPMAIRRTRRDPNPMLGRPPTFRNEVSHWWDGSQLYGSTLARQREVRSGNAGKLTLVEPQDGLVENPLLPLDESNREGIDLTGSNDNYWLGLSLLHTLFAREHNAICDRLAAEYPSWDDEELFQRARLINAALMAKIHTVEWTPALLDTRTLHTAMNANWRGVLPDWLRRRLPWHLGEALSGIVGSPHYHHDGVPYSMTEEFVSVYRMHSLMPDSFSLRRAVDDSPLEDIQFTAIQGLHTRSIMERISMTDSFYSFGTSHPGQITLHNYPNELRSFRKIESGTSVHIDLAAVDILRDRERGVPRYTEFRELLGLDAPATFEQMTPNKEWARELREIYGTPDRVDLLVGMLAEELPEGFAFSETAFRIFTLMASRRLSSDPFFTRDYRPAVYTQIGLDWIENTTFTSVLKRHFPELTPALEGLPTAFSPWHRPRPAQA